MHHFIGAEVLALRAPSSADLRINLYTQRSHRYTSGAFSPCYLYPQKGSKQVRRCRMSRLKTTSFEIYNLFRTPNLNATVFYGGEYLTSKENKVNLYYTDAIMRG